MGALGAAGTTLRAGYVGCGFMAQNAHLPSFASAPGCELVAIAERRPRLAQAVAERYRVGRVYSSHHQLAADPEIDCVGVSAPYAEQGHIAADLLRAGKHVFMEKPMAVSIAQAETILAAEAAGGARLMVAYMKRHDPGNIAARDVVARWRGDGSHGRPLLARAHGFCGDWTAALDTSGMIQTDEVQEGAPVTRDLPAWLPAEAASGYINYLQQWTHNINLLRFLTGCEDRASVRSVDLDADGMTGIAVLDLDGIRAVLESGLSNFHHWDEHTQVFFEGGWVRVTARPMFQNPSQSEVEIYTGGAEASYVSPLARPLNTWPYREQVRAFIDCLRSARPFLSGARDTLTDVRLCEAIYQRHLGLAAK